MPTDDSYATDDSSISAVVRSQPDSIVNMNPFSYLHSALHNQFYEDLSDAVQEEDHNLVDFSVWLRTLFNVDYYDGDINNFYDKIDNLMILLMGNYPTAYINFIANQATNGNSEYLPVLQSQNDFLRRLVKKTYVLRRWSGTYNGYFVLFHLLNRNGGVHPKTKYPLLTVITPTTEKQYRILDVSQFNKIIPGTPESKFPNSVNIQGTRSVQNVTTFTRRWDLGNIWDNGVEPNVDKWDQLFGFPVYGAGIFLEIGLDRLLIADDSSYYLMDDQMLRAIDTLLPKVQKASDDIQVGSQITLLASKDGRFNTLSTDTNWTHPNIRAKFQVLKYLPDNQTLAWISGTNVFYIKVGTGGYGNPLVDNHIFIPAGTSDPPPIYNGTTGFIVPTDVQKPIFTSYVGQNEHDPYGLINYFIINTTLHPRIIGGYSITVPLGVNGFNTVNFSPTAITIPNSDITDGSVQYNVDFTKVISGTTVVQRLRIFQTYNAVKGVYDSAFTYQEPDISIPPNYFDVSMIETINGYTVDPNFSNINYFPHASKKMIILLSLIAEDKYPNLKQNLLASWTLDTIAEYPDGGAQDYLQYQWLTSDATHDNWQAPAPGTTLSLTNIQNTGSATIPTGFLKTVIQGLLPLPILSRIFTPFDNSSGNKHLIVKARSSVPGIMLEAIALINGVSTSLGLREIGQSFLLLDYPIPTGTNITQISFSTPTIYVNNEIDYGFIYVGTLVNSSGNIPDSSINISVTPGPLNGNTATVLNGRVSYGTPTKAISLNGTASMSVTNISNSFNNLDRLSFSCIMSIDAVSSNNNRVVFGKTNDSLSVGWGLQMIMLGSNYADGVKLRFTANKLGNINHPIPQSGIWESTITNVTQQNIPFHLAFIYDNTAINGVPSIYINGVINPTLQTQAPIGDQIDDSASNFFIGGTTTNSNKAIITLQNIKFWHRILSLSEIQELFSVEPIRNQQLIDSYGNPTYIFIDVIAGRIAMKMQYNSQGILQGDATYNNYLLENSDTIIENYNLNNIAGEVAISEMGLFDGQMNMVAYATFPPIKYNASKHHLSFNILVQT